MLMYAVIASVLLPAIFASRDFSNNIPDPRCKARGDLLTYPHDRCKYVVCEFGSTSVGYRKGKIYARVMECAPGTVVPLDHYRNPMSIIKGTPCTEFYTGKCPAATTGGGYSNGGQSYRNRRQSYGNQGQSYGNTHQSYGNQGQSYGNRQQSYGNQGQSYGNMRQGYGNSAQTYAFDFMPSYDEHRSSYGKSTSSRWQSAGSQADSRCTKVGQFLTHATDRCKYVVCEFARNTLNGAVTYDTTEMFARVMHCPPGTAVQSSRYGETYLMSSPCTEFYSGQCPARPGTSNSRRPATYRYY